MVQGVFSWVDLVMTPIWLLILYLLAYAISHIKYKDPYLRKHFMWGLTVKFIGCFGFIAVYAFYYGYGDTFGYFENVTKLREVIHQNPVRIFHLLFSENLTVQEQISVGISAPDHVMSNAANYMVIRIALFIGFFTFGSYISTSLIFAFGSFLGIWGLYRIVSYLYPKLYRSVTFPILYIPSVFFWGSSLMKDSIVIGFLGIMTYTIYQLFFRHKKVLLSFIMLVISIYVLANVKQYVIVAYAPALILWMSLGPLKKLPQRQKWIAAPFLILFAAIIIAAVFPILEKMSKRYTIERVLVTAEKTATYIHRTTREGGSSYSLGEVSYTPLGLVRVFPKAVTVSLFQPFIFQVKNPVMVLSAMESTLFLLGTIYILLKMGLMKFINYMMNNPFLLMCLVFSVFFAFAIGISTYNFGALVRYKIPCLPFYGIALIIPYMDNKRRISSEVDTT